MFDYHEQKVIEELKSQLDLLEKQFDYHKRRMTELENSILSIEDALSGADAVMTLRLQQERMKGNLTGHFQFVDQFLKEIVGEIFCLNHLSMRFEPLEVASAKYLLSVVVK